MIGVGRVDFIGVRVRDLAEADAYFADTLDLFERNPGSTDRWVEDEAPNVTLALVPSEYTGGKHEPLPFASASFGSTTSARSASSSRAAVWSSWATDSTPVSATGRRSSRSTATG
jgi:hypothetical protein